MGITSLPNGLSSMGNPVTGGNYITTGSVYFVDSNTGLDTNDGHDPDHAFATWDHAFSHCTSGVCDYIFLMPNHAETLGTTRAVTLDVSGVHTIGLGRGDTRPIFTVGTTAGAGIYISAHSMYLENMVFKAGLDALTAPIRLVTGGSECTLKDIEWRSASAMEPQKVITCDSDAGRITIDGLIIKEDIDVAGTDTLNYVEIQAPRMVEIKNCWLTGRPTTGGIINTTSNSGSDAAYPSWIHHNIIENISSVSCVVWTSDNKGTVISDNYFKVATADEQGTTGILNCFYFQNFTVNTDGEQGGMIDGSCLCSTADD